MRTIFAGRSVIASLTLVGEGRAMKRIYVYPLCRDVQRRLALDSTPRWIQWEEP